MNENKFAAWVEPFAKQYRENRADAIDLARSLSADALGRPTGDTGWSVREELVHIAASDSDFLRTLGAILRGENVDTSVFADIDARNARNLAECQGRSIEQVASDLEQNGEALQKLVAQLTDGDESRQPEGFPFPLRGLIEGYGMHEPYHVAQIRTAIGAEGR
jgi:uncharacterized damage-inducible protein DinB